MEPRYGTAGLQTCSRNAAVSTHPSDHAGPVPWLLPKTTPGQSFSSSSLHGPWKQESFALNVLGHFGLRWGPASCER